MFNSIGYSVHIRGVLRVHCVYSVLLFIFALIKDVFSKVFNEYGDTLLSIILYIEPELVQTYIRWFQEQL